MTSPFSPAAPADPRWAALRARDPAADGRFVFAVRTTGVYCRPSCPSRPARPGNVGFFADPAEAEASGFRPCRRCRPKDTAAPAEALAARVCGLIDAAEAEPTLAELAGRLGLSPAHLQRRFKAATGLTPKAYAAGRRAERLGRALASGHSVTASVYAAGYGASSRAYAAAGDRLGMTPGLRKAGGAAVVIHHAAGTSSLGAVLVARSGRGVCAILLGDDPAALLDDLRRRFPRATLLPGDAAFAELVGQVVALVERPASGLGLTLDLQGTLFQQRVWAALREIPAGTTVSYAELARKIGEPRAVRAVAGACGANPVAVAVPCHRVVRTGGELSGYRWGLGRKRALLAREAEAATPPGAA